MAIFDKVDYIEIEPALTKAQRTKTAKGCKFLS